MGKVEEERQAAKGLPVADWVDEDIDRTGPSGDGNFTYVDISSVDRISKVIKNPKLLPVDKAPSRAKQVLRTGDVLVAMTRPNLNAVAKVPTSLDGAIGSTGFHVLRSRYADPGFLYYGLQTRAFIDAMCLKVQGALYPAIRPSDVSSFCLPPFSLTYQRRIVAKIEELFSELDAGVESLKTARAQLGVYRQSLLKQAFEGKLTENWRAANPDKLESADQLLERIRKEREARYQQQLTDWKAATAQWEKAGKSGKKPAKPRKLKPMEPLSEAITGTLFDVPEYWFWGKVGLMTCGVEYGSSAKSKKVGSCPVIRMGNIQRGELDWEDLVFSSDAEEIESYRLRKGDVLFNRTNSPEHVGKTAIFRGNRTAIFAGYLIRVNHIPSIVEGEYLNFFLNSHTAKQYGNTVKTDGVNQSNINGEKLSNYPFPFCSLPEQREIVRILEEQFSAIEQNEREIDTALERAEALRQSILKKAFSGKLVPQDPSDEPASVLLERFCAEHSSAEQEDKAVGKLPKKRTVKKVVRRRAKRARNES